MEELISKKDLLSKTNISYGQLYRWKRKNIIPEEWFIKKSAFTGQETFFPRDKILERIELILSMKEETSLDDIANMFMKKDINKEFDIDFILSKEVICNYTKEIFKNLYNKEQSIGKKELLILNIIEKFLVKSTITFEELKLIVNIIEENFMSIYNENGKIYLFRKFGVPFVVGCLDYKKVKFEKDVVKIIEIDLTKEINDISIKLS
ncbi:TPA: YhbD family protein [Clostridioides difficile]|nr:YhbD family protein [Clostridioides difficile]HBF6480308.1 YhbD family protein [Clostridioides difficile]HBF6527571.1 YhbD family protein [Clostridioides difficile]HBG7858042.1 YhbD family protein [Clostridioides difficile]